MAGLRAVALAAPLVVVLSGCATSKSTNDSSDTWLVDERSEETDWFCEPAEGGGWDCVQDPDRVANPRPLRLPEPLFEPIGTAEQAPRPPSSSPPAPPSPRAPPPPPPVDPVQDAPDDPPIPLYRRLAHRPDQTTPLADLPGNFYAIQLIALSSKEVLEQYIIDNNLPPMSRAVVEKDGKRFHALLAGIYPDRETAERAVRSLPEEIGVHGPWVRSMESLQAGIARAEQLAE